MNIAAFDIGGTALKWASAPAAGELLEKGKQSIIDSDGDQILQAMLAWIAAHPTCEGVAIGAPAMSTHTGFIEMGGAIRQFDNFAIKRWLEQQTGLPVAIENDANCVLLAERWQGKAVDMSDFLVLTIGTGVGGAIFVTTSWCMARVFARRIRLYADRTPGARDVRRSSMNENCTMRVLRDRYAGHVGKSLEAVTGEEIFDRYEAGDAVCQRLVADFSTVSVPVCITGEHFLIRRPFSSAAALWNSRAFGAAARTSGLVRYRGLSRHRQPRQRCRFDGGGLPF